MANADVTWIDVLPSMKSFLPTLMRELGSSMPRAGQQAGQDFGSGFGRGAVNLVEQASAKMHAALRKVEDATGQLRVAEARLQDLRDSGKAKASQLVAAEENLAKAKRNLDAQNEQATRSTHGLAEAEERAARESRDLDRSLDGVHKRTSLFHGALGALGGVMAGLSFAAVGRGFYSIGATFDEVTDTIRSGTGATGQALNGLVASAKTVGKNVPAEFEAIGATIAQVNQRLGLTGPTLEKFSSQLLEAGRLTNETIDVTGLSAAFSQFNVTGDQTTVVMDELFRVSQATGVGINQLATGLVKGGPVLQQFGFDVGESAVLLGTLDKAGLNSDATLTALRKALVEFAKAGRDPQEALRGTITEIQRFVAEGNMAGAIDLASKLFGTRGASQFVAAVQSGAVNVEALTAAAGQSGDTILGVANETKDFSERWLEFKNRVLVWLEPVAATVFGALGNAMVWVSSASTAFGDAWRRNDGVVTQSGMLGFVERFGSVTRQVFDFLSQSMTAFVNSWRYNDGQITSSGFQAFMERLGYAARQTFDFFRDHVIPVLASTIRWFGDNAWAVGVLAGAFIAVRAAMVAHTAAMFIAENGMRAFFLQSTLISGATKAWAAVQWLLNASLMGFPLVWIAAALIAVGAGLYLLWTRSETFRDIVLGVWNAIQTAISWAWERVIKPTWDALSAAWSAVVTGIRAAWDSVLRPAWDAVAAVFTWLWKTILEPYLGALLAYWTAVVTGMVWAWNNILRPAWDFLVSYAQTMFQILWNTVFIPLRVAWEVMSAAIVWAWNNVIRPAWDLLTAAIRFLYENVARPIWSAMSTAWDALARGIRWVFDNIIDPAFNALKSALGTVQDTFRTVVDWIGRIWDGLRGALARPINFMIGTVWNNGIRKAWNLVAAILPGVDPVGEAQLIPERRAGGALHGPGTGTSDSILGVDPRSRRATAWVSNGEHIVTKEEVDAAGGHSAWYALRQAVLRRGRPLTGEDLAHFVHGGELLRRATGGELFAEIRKEFPRANLNSGYRAGDPGYHGRNQAVDLGEQGFAGGAGRPYLAAMKRWLVDNYGRSNEIIYNGAGNDRTNIKDGRSYAYSAAIQQQHRNHVHWAQAAAIAAARSSGAAGVGNALKDAGGNVVDFLQSMLAQITKLFTIPARAAVNAIPFNAPPTFLGLPKKIGHSIIDKAIEFFNGKAQEQAASGVEAGAPGAGVERWRGTVMTALRRNSQSDSLADTTLRRMQKESGGNPNAINNWDVNAKRGTPSKGLMQVIDPTFARYRDPGLVNNIWDPLANVSASMRYALARYGSLSAAYNRAGGYALGGEVRPQLLDDGGLWGPGVGFNLTGDLERVMAPEQDDYFRRFVDVGEQLVADSRRGELIGELHQHFHGDNNEFKAVQELEHSLHVADLGGRYAWVDGS